jgi:hypothetical protein
MELDSPLVVLSHISVLTHIKNNNVTRLLMQIYAIMTRSMALSLTLMHSLWLLTPPLIILKLEWLATTTISLMLSGSWSGLLGNSCPDLSRCAVYASISVRDDKLIMYVVFEWLISLIIMDIIFMFGSHF